MGDSLYIMFKEGVTMPVEPTGTLKSQGWMPGIWAKYSLNPLTFSGAVATVDLSDGTGILAGFLVTGPQHMTPVQKLSDMWTTDSRQRPGGETRADWTAFDAGGAIDFDTNSQLQRMGSRIATMVCPPSGMHKIYVFEVDDLAERTTPGTGSALVYQAGNPLYVSDRGRFTNEQESPAHPWTGYVAAGVGNDDEGNYLVTAPAMA